MTPQPRRIDRTVLLPGEGEPSLWPWVLGGLLGLVALVALAAMVADEHEAAWRAGETWSAAGGPAPTGPIRGEEPPCP